MAMRNPLRSEAEMYRFLWIVVGGAIVIVVAAVIYKWLGVAAAVIAFAALGWWLTQGGTTESPPKLVSGTPEGTHRVLVLAPPGTDRVQVSDRATETLVVVPALASTVEALTGAVDDRRADAEATAAALGEQLGARAEVGADDPALAVEDALRVYGADEVLVAGGDGWMEAIRERVAIPVSQV